MNLFPGAGSFGGEFAALLDAVGRGARLVRYPGRQGRGFGVPAGSFDALVAACLAQVARPGPDRPVLVGHSFGAYAAYATAAALERSGTEVAALVVLGAAAPAGPAVPVVAADTAADVAAYLDQVDQRVLADAPSDEWRTIVAETARDDLRLLGRYDPGPRPGVRCPVWAARGEADPLTTEAGIAGWAGCTTGAFSRRTFPGGHSDLLRSPAGVAWLRDRVQPLPPGA